MNHYYQNINFKKQCFKTSAVFKDDLLNLTIFENGAAWNLTLSKDDISKQARDIAKQDEDSYYNNLKIYLRSCPENVEFNFIAGELNINLLLKNKMKILFFTSTLKQVDFDEHIFHLVERLYEDKVQCFRKLENLERQHKNLQTDNNNLMEKLDSFLEQKKVEEEKLYSQFLTVLNEKKLHIQHLNDLLIAVKKGRSSINPVLNNIKKNNGQSRNKLLTKEVANIKMFSESKDSSASYNYKTDNDDADSIDGHINTLRMSPRASSSGPTTSKYKSSFIEDAPTTLFEFSKRIRTNCNLSTSDELPDKLLSRDSNIHENTITMVSDTATTEASPMVTFNTQDLLDNL